MRSAACGLSSAVVTTAAAYQDDEPVLSDQQPPIAQGDRGGACSVTWHADRRHTYGSGQLMIGTELMLFFGLPSMTRSL